MLKLSLSKSLDAICLGRAGMDLYAQESETDFFDVTAFDKHVGGSPANTAVGMARLGASAGLISKISDDVVGRYVKQFLVNEGVDVTGVASDSSGTRTSLAVTEVKNHQCAVVIYRNNAADLALSADDIEEGFVTSARVLVVSGTALSAEPSRTATRKAMAAACANGTHVVLDLDYRAYTWPSDAEATQVYQQAATQAHTVIGNREEYQVLGVGTDNAARIANLCLNDTTELVIVKSGADGAALYPREGPAFAHGIYPVASKKPFGAGDAYAAALLAGLTSGKSLQDAAHAGAAAAAIVVAGTGCSAASPTAAELEKFMQSHELLQPVGFD